MVYLCHSPEVYHAAIYVSNHGITATFPRIYYPRQGLKKIDRSGIIPLGQKTLPLPFNSPMHHDLASLRIIKGYRVMDQ